MVNFEREVLERLKAIEVKIDMQDYKGLSEKVESQHDSLIEDEQIIKNHEDRIKSIEDNNRWLWRTVAGALLLGALAILFGI